MEIKLSVRNLVEFVLRSGDIDNSYVSQDRMVQGIRATRNCKRNMARPTRLNIFLKIQQNLAG